MIGLDDVKVRVGSTTVTPTNTAENRFVLTPTISLETSPDGLERWKRTLKAAKDRGCEEGRTAIDAADADETPLNAARERLARAEGDAAAAHKAVAAAGRKVTQTVKAGGDTERAERELAAAREKVARLRTRVPALKKAADEAETAWREARGAAKRLARDELRRDAQEELDKLAAEIGEAIVLRLERIYELRGVLEATGG